MTPTRTRLAAPVASGSGSRTRNRRQWAPRQTGSRNAGPDATISASEETFEKIRNGEQNPTSAYMTGKLKIKGDMGAAMKLQKLF